MDGWMDGWIGVEGDEKLNHWVRRPKGPICRSRKFQPRGWIFLGKT